MVDFKIHSHLQEFWRHHGKYRKAKQAYVSITCKPCSTHIISFTRPSQHPFKWILTRISFCTRLFKSWKQSLSTTKLPVLLSFVIGSNLRIGNWIPLTHKRKATISVAWYWFLWQFNRHQGVVDIKLLVWRERLMEKLRYVIAFQVGETYELRGDNCSLLRQSECG